ncbi:hypothetical protein TRFO_33139 [Tritrichomonas foetus]|uniref:DUF3447 domain-containing protein n=1 Tax=Tritrichomonas foetus TaxID=1144522 RepID=A0A1J4JPA9_9EUKA|nr:hypothetical protein TRFO_33139 [Tritrichomonas foetus]|eukprot:OHT00224.1 hypothetical protein TRFO_33139 [Tritrichomonas foetus]
MKCPIKFTSLNPPDWHILVNEKYCSCYKKTAIKVSPVIAKFAKENPNSFFSFSLDNWKYLQDHTNDIKIISSILNDDVTINDNNWKTIKIVSKKLEIQDLYEKVKEFKMNYADCALERFENNPQLKKMLSLQTLLKNLTEENLETSIQTFNEYLHYYSSKELAHIVYCSCISYLPQIDLIIKLLLSFQNILYLVIEKLRKPSKFIINHENKNNHLKNFIIYRIYKNNPLILTNFLENCDQNSIDNDYKEIEQLEFLREIIMKDDIEAFQYLKSTMMLPFSNQMGLFQQPIGSVHLSAMFGSFKIFKYLFLNNSAMQSDIVPFAFIGGNIDIVRLCEQKKLIEKHNNVKLLLKISIIFHHQPLFEWIYNGSIIKSSKIKKDALLKSFVKFSIKYCNMEVLLFLRTQMIRLSSFLPYAVCYDLCSIAKGMLSYPRLNPNICWKPKLTAIHYSILNQNFELFLLLLNNKKINLSVLFPNLTYGDMNLFHFACLNDKTGVFLKFMIKNDKFDHKMIYSKTTFTRFFEYPPIYEMCGYAIAFCSKNFIALEILYPIFKNAPKDLLVIDKFGYYLRHSDRRHTIKSFFQEMYPKTNCEGLRKYII